MYTVLCINLALLKCIPKYFILFDAIINRLFYFYKDFIYLFFEGKGGKKRGREIATCGCVSCVPAAVP